MEGPDGRPISPINIEGDRRYHPSMEYCAPGARFFAEVSRCSIMKTEISDVYKDIKLFELYDVDIAPLKVPQEYWPYPNCIFSVLSEPDNDIRFTKLRELFLVLGQPGDPSESIGLFYTVMHLWKFVYFVAMVRPTARTIATFGFIMKAGMFQSLMRILERSCNRKFLLTEYNRLVPYRSLELIFAATQAAYEYNDDVVNTVLEDPQRAVRVFYPLLCGEVSCMEQILACQLAANFSCYPKGVTWLLDNPRIVGKVGMHLWSTYDILYKEVRQYEELLVPYMKQLVFARLEVVKDHKYEPLPISIADLNTFVVLCCLCNVCAAHPDDEPMVRIEPSLLAVVKEGLYIHMGTVSYGIILNDNKYHQELCIEKFLSFLSWSCFQKETQKLVIEQLHSLPVSRNDFPLFYAKDSYTISRSVIACLITHANHLDYEKGSHFATLALIFLLKESETVAMEVVRVAGDTLFDMAHSIYHAQMPSNEKPISLKRMVLETMLKFGGSSFFSETGFVVKPTENKFEEPVPECINEARAFCLRFLREIKMKRYEKQKLVRCADEFKAEGNKFFTKKNYHSAIECYSKALDTCPLTCTERRVTYYSNRAECYLKTDQSRRALRDCNKALAQNPNNLRTRWRRAQAFQNMKKRFPAALDLLTIRRHRDEAKQILGERLYHDLDKMIFNLMDGCRFYSMAGFKNGPQVVSGGITKTGALNQDHKENKHKLPPFRGKYYHDIFGYGRGDYLK